MCRLMRSCKLQLSELEKQHAVNRYSRRAHLGVQKGWRSSDFLAASVHRYPARFPWKIRTRSQRQQPGFKDVKRSTYVTFQQLAELYAKGVLEEFGFSVRMCPRQGTYPAKLPAKKILPTSFKPGSSFDLAVQKV